MFVVIVLTVIAVICIFEYFIKYGRVGKYVNKMPGPFAWPIFGNIPQQFKSPDKLFKVLAKWDNAFYPIYRVWNLHKAIVIVLHPDDIEKIFTSIKHLQKSIFYNPLRGWLGDGLLVSHGDKWHTRRKMLTPAFHFRVLQLYVESMVEHGEVIMNSLKSNGETVYNITELVSDFTLNIICETVMGVKVSDKDFLKKYREAIHHLGVCTIYRITKPWFLPENLFLLSHKGRAYRKSLKTLHDFTKKILKERKEYHEKTNNKFLNDFLSNESNKTSADDIYYVNGKKRLAMLDLLIAEQLEGHIDDQGILEELDTFTFEGHDTTAMALSYAILLIAEHEDVQSRIRNEVSQVLNSNGGKLAMLEIQSFNYLEMCLKECLRLYPVVANFSRYITEDLQLTNYVVPKGAVVLTFPYAVHRASKFWPDPEKFDPDRFLPENTKGRHPYSYIPFSAGSRNCIGKKFAMLELKIFISLLIYNFILIPVTATNELSYTTDLVLRTTEPIRVKFVPIKK